MERKIRVLVAKPGLDGHDRGAKVVASAFRDAGMEVVYTGLHQTPEMIVEVDVVGLSILSGAHMVIFPKILDLLKEKGAGDKLVVAGGIIPEDDSGALREIGVAEVFGPGTRTSDIVEYVKKEMTSRMK